MNITPIQHTPQAASASQGPNDQRTAATPNPNQIAGISAIPATLAGVMGESLMGGKIIAGLTVESTHRLAACSKEFRQIALAGFNAVAPKLVEELSTVTPQVKARCKNMTIADPSAPDKVQLIDQAQQRSRQSGRMNIPAASAGIDIDGLNISAQNPSNILIQRLRNQGL